MQEELGHTALASQHLATASRSGRQAALCRMAHHLLTNRRDFVTFYVLLKCLVLSLSLSSFISFLLSFLSSLSFLSFSFSHPSNSDHGQQPKYFFHVSFIPTATGAFLFCTTSTARWVSFHTTSPKLGSKPCVTRHQVTAE